MQAISKKTIATMKNLFKNLMLVAVAAMAFTACTEENNEVNAVAKKTVITGVASMGDDTRSGFVGSETIDNGDGTTTTVYKSAWDGTETIKLFAENGLETTAAIDAEGKFTAEFEGELPESFFMTVCSPVESWSSQYTYTIPQVQTPRANSVDPAAHIVQAQNVGVVGGTAAFFKMQHMLGYGKMTINTPAEFVIDHVDIELNGAWYGYERNYSYTINADNVENNTFWFATDVIEVADFTVTAYDAEGNAYTKSVTIPDDRELSFTYGGVTKFSVSNLEVYEKPAGPMFTSAETSSYGYDKYIYFYSADNTLSTLKVNAYGCFSGSSWDIWNEGTYTTDWVPGVGMIYTGQYTTYGGINTESITVIVSHVKEGYKVVIKNVTDSNGNVLLEEATYVGPISGLTTPDLRTQLEIPNVESSISGKTLTLTWEAIENAEGYLVECTSSGDINPISTTETTVTITVPTYDYYSFSVQAVVSEDSATYRSSEKAYVEYNDPRVALSAPTNITATVDGPSVTISWDAVEGADGYQLRYYLNGDQIVDVDDTTKTIDLGYNQSNLWIYVSSVADDTNDTYRSSEPWDASVVVSTGKDPNVLADNILESVSVKSDYIEFYRSYVGDGSSHSSNTTASLRIYMHSNDRGDNYINTGEYSCVGSGGYVPTAAGTVNMRFNKDTYWAYYATANASSTLSIRIVDNEYVIIATINGETWGYKGMPDGWVAPEGSGNEEPENPGEGGGETPDPEPGQPGDSGDSSDVPAGYNAVEYVSFEPGSYMGRTYNWIGDFTFDFQGATIKFTMCDFNGSMQAQNKVVVEGVYTNNGNGANTDTMELYNISISGMSGNSGSTVEVSKDGSDYVFKMIMKTVNGDYKFYYKGAL